MSRAELARQQAELISALAGRRSPPDRFDARRVRIAAEALRDKRVRSIARVWPRLARAPEFPAALERHLREHPAPPPSGALGDGRALARAMAAEGWLPWEARLELAEIELRWRWTAAGRRLPRRAAVALAGRRWPPRAVVAVRLPLLGERWLPLPFTNT
ncbi:MAG TPA: hypothetical protein VIC57_04650 [Candidatus Dormibacteraeota bacterium]